MDIDSVDIGSIIAWWLSFMPQWNLQAKCHQYVFNPHYLSLPTQLIQLIKLEQPTQLKSCFYFTDCILSCFQFFFKIPFLKGGLFSKQDVIQKYFRLHMLMWEKLKSKASNGILIQLIFFSLLVIFLLTIIAKVFPIQWLEMRKMWLQTFSRVIFVLLI